MIAVAFVVALSLAPAPSSPVPPAVTTAIAPLSGGEQAARERQAPNISTPRQSGCRS